jgi:hypothetical protein
MVTVVNGSIPPFKCINSEDCCDDNNVTVFPDWLVSVKVSKPTANRVTWSFAELASNTVTEVFPLSFGGGVVPEPQLVEIPMPNSIASVRVTREKADDAERTEKHAAFIESSNTPRSTSLIQARRYFEGNSIISGNL